MERTGQMEQEDGAPGHFAQTKLSAQSSWPDIHLGPRKMELNGNQDYLSLTKSETLIYQAENILFTDSL